MMSGNVERCGLTPVRLACPLWFSPGTMRWFGGRVSDYGYRRTGGTVIWFVSSERDTYGSVWGGARRYTVRRWDPDNPTDIGRDGDMGQYATRNGAHGAARRLAAGGET
jgi:hypothetical protein